MTVRKNQLDVNTLSVEQFGEQYLPGLVSQLRAEYPISFAEAHQLGSIVIDKLKDRFLHQPLQAFAVFHRAIVIIVQRETNKYQRLKEKNFGLSEDRFQQMVERLQAGDEQMYETLFLSQFGSCMGILKHKYQASHQDAYDATMEAMVLFCRKLKESKISYGNLQFLFTQMSVQIYLKWIKRQKKVEAFTHFNIPDRPPQFDRDSLQAMQQAFSRLGEGCRQVLRAFYHDGTTLQALATHVGRTPAAVRKQKQRCIEKLRVIYTKIS